MPMATRHERTTLNNHNSDLLFPIDDADAFEEAVLNAAIDRSDGINPSGPPPAGVVWVSRVASVMHAG